MVAESKTTAPSIELIHAGKLMDDKIMFEFAIYYLPTPEKDYIRRYANGKAEGNETGKIIEKNSGTARDRKD